MKRLRAAAVNVVVALLTTAVVLLAIEGVARYLVARSLARPFTTRGSIVRYHPTLGWDKPFGTSAWLHRAEYSVHLEVNSRGLRGPDRDYAKPPGVLRTLLLGDSHTEGYTVSEDHTLRAVLEGELNRGCARRHEVIN